MPVLGIHLDALARLLSLADPAPTAKSAADTVLLHEQRYWRSAANARGLGQLDEITLRAATAIAALYGAASPNEAEAIIAVTPGTRDQSEDRRAAVGAWLAELYPAGERYWGSLQPDRLAEHHIGLVLADRADLVPATADACSRGQAEHALTVLARAVPDHPHLASAIRTSVLTAPDTFGPAAIDIAVQVPDPGALRAALDALPGTFLPDLAASLHNRSIRLGQAGQRHEALAAIQEARTIRQWLAEAHPGAHHFLDDLAMSLTSFSTNLSELGRWDQARAAGDGAVNIYLGTYLPGNAPPAKAYLPNIARAIKNLSARREECGDLEGAKADMGMAAHIYLGLAARHPRAYGHECLDAMENDARLTIKLDEEKELDEEERTRRRGKNSTERRELDEEGKNSKNLPPPIGRRAEPKTRSPSTRRWPPTGCGSSARSTRTPLGHRPTLPPPTGMRAASTTRSSFRRKWSPTTCGSWGRRTRTP